MAGTFPPSKGNANANVANANKPESGAFSTGQGGLKASLKVKNAAIKQAPGAGPDKDVNLN